MDCFHWKIPGSLIGWPRIGSASKLAMAYLWNLAECKPGVVRIRLTEMGNDFGRSATAARKWLKQLEKEALVLRQGYVDGSWFVLIHDPDEVRKERQEVLSLHAESLANRMAGIRGKTSATDLPENLQPANNDSPV